MKTPGSRDRGARRIVRRQGAARVLLHRRSLQNFQTHSEEVNHAFRRTQETHRTGMHPPACSGSKSHAAVAELSKSFKAKKTAFFHLEGEKNREEGPVLQPRCRSNEISSTLRQNWDAFTIASPILEGQGRELRDLFRSHPDAFAEHHESEVETLIEIFRCCGLLERRRSRHAGAALRQTSHGRCSETVESPILARRLGDFNLRGARLLTRRPF